MKFSLPSFTFCVVAFSPAIKFFFDRYLPIPLSLLSIISLTLALGAFIASFGKHEIRTWLFAFSSVLSLFLFLRFVSASFSGYQYPFDIIFSTLLISVYILLGSFSRPPRLAVLIKYYLCFYFVVLFLCLFLRPDYLLMPGLSTHYQSLSPLLLSGLALFLSLSLETAKPRAIFLFYIFKFLTSVSSIYIALQSNSRALLIFSVLISLCWFVCGLLVRLIGLIRDSVKYSAFSVWSLFSFLLAFFVLVCAFYFSSQSSLFTFIGFGNSYYASKLSAFIAGDFSNEIRLNNFDYYIDQLQQLNLFGSTPHSYLFRSGGYPENFVVEIFVDYGWLIGFMSLFYFCLPFLQYFFCIRTLEVSVRHSRIFCLRLPFFDSIVLRFQPFSLSLAYMLYFSVYALAYSLASLGFIFYVAPMIFLAQYSFFKFASFRDVGIH